MFKYLTTIAGALTPLLYIHGNTYWYGYLTALSVPPDLFPISFEETLIQGYIAYSILGIPYLIVIFAYLLVALFAVHNANEISKLNWVKKVVEFFSARKMEEQEKGHPITELTLGYSKKATLVAGVITLIIGGSLLLLIEMDQLGKTSGENKLKKIIETPLTSVYLKGSTNILGTLLLCGNEFCAIFYENNTTVIPITSIKKLVNKVNGKKP